MFPSPYGVSFILMSTKDTDILVQEAIVSVSLRSIVHSYTKSSSIVSHVIGSMFPSPYGVSFILIDIGDDGWDDVMLAFPSPYGVSFILILVIYPHHHSLTHTTVSVSLRSIVHSYTCQNQQWVLL